MFLIFIQDRSGIATYIHTIPASYAHTSMHSKHPPASPRSTPLCCQSGQEREHSSHTRSASARNRSPGSEAVNEMLALYYISQLNSSSSSVSEESSQIKTRRPTTLRLLRGPCCSSSSSSSSSQLLLLASALLVSLPLSLSSLLLLLLLLLLLPVELCNLGNSQDVLWCQFLADNSGG